MFLYSISVSVTFLADFCFPGVQNDNSSEICTSHFLTQSFFIIFHYFLRKHQLVVWNPHLVRNAHENFNFSP